MCVAYLCLSTRRIPPVSSVFTSIPHPCLPILPSIKSFTLRSLLRLGLRCVILSLNIQNTRRVVHKTRVKVLCVCITCISSHPCAYVQTHQNFCVERDFMLHTRCDLCTAHSIFTQNAAKTKTTKNRGQTGVKYNYLSKGGMRDYTIKLIYR